MSQFVGEVNEVREPVDAAAHHSTASAAGGGGRYGPASMAHRPSDFEEGGVHAVDSTVRKRTWINFINETGGKVDVYVENEELVRLWLKANAEVTVTAGGGGGGGKIDLQWQYLLKTSAESLVLGAEAPHNRQKVNLADGHNTARVNFVDTTQETSPPHFFAKSKLCKGGSTYKISLGAPTSTFSLPVSASLYAATPGKP